MVWLVSIASWCVFLLPTEQPTLPKMADSNQQSPPPQLGPVVSWLFDPHTYYFSPLQVHSTDSAYKDTHHKEYEPTDMCVMSSVALISKVGENPWWWPFCEREFSKLCGNFSIQCLIWTVSSENEYKSVKGSIYFRAILVNCFILCTSYKYTHSFMFFI